MTKIEEVVEEGDEALTENKDTTITTSKEVLEVPAQKNNDNDLNDDDSEEEYEYDSEDDSDDEEEMSGLSGK